jgi:hypothetical protein
MAVCLMLGTPGAWDTTPGSPYIELPSVVHHYLNPELMRSTAHRTLDPCDSTEFFGESLEAFKGYVSRARVRVSKEDPEVSVSCGFELLPTGVRREVFISVSKDELERTLDGILRLIAMAEERKLAVVSLGD